MHAIDAYLLGFGAIGDYYCKLNTWASIKPAIGLCNNN